MFQVVNMLKCLRQPNNSNEFLKQQSNKIEKCIEMNTMKHAFDKNKTQYDKMVAQQILEIEKNKLLMLQIEQ